MVSGISLAEEAKGELASKETILDLCDESAKLAKTIMKIYQDGTPLIKVLSLAKDDRLRAMIISAYSESRYSTKSYKQDAIEKFSNKMHIECLNKEYQ